MKLLDNNGLPSPRVLIIAAIALAPIFIFLPQIDIAIAEHLRSGDNTKFIMQANWLGDFFALRLMNIMLVLLGLWAASWGLSEITGRFFWGLSRRKYFFSLSSIILSAGLVTNLIFKDIWGRARPVHLVEFGGTKTFSPAFIISDQCSTNCSFFSGDVSFAFSMLAIALVAPEKLQPRLVKGVLLFGIIVSAQRMLRGAHFLSDVIFAAIFTILITQGMKFLILDRVKLALKDEP